MDVMAVKTLVTEEEYLQTRYGDRTPEYIDGEVVERSMPNNSHSKAQVELLYAFRRAQERAPLYVRSELRVRVAPRKFRIADVVVYAGVEPTEEVPSQIPLAVIEIVSPGDTHEDTMTRLEDYRALGVPNVWLVEPGLRVFYVYANGSLTRVESLELPEHGVRIHAAEIV
jgi:Uma2 family endonuclease